MNDKDCNCKEPFDWFWFFLCAAGFVWVVLMLLEEYNVIEGSS